jgi:hypothetical protein
MNNLRRWQLDAQSPFCLQLAADSRLSITDYSDDQIWELSPGTFDSPALALQTRYGGRVGLVSIVPMWQHEGRTIYQAQAYAKTPLIEQFAPGYVRLTAALTLQITLQAEYWVIESHTVGARFTLTNADTKPVDVRLDLFGHIGANGKEILPRIVSAPDGQIALEFSKIGNLKPIIIMDEGGAVEMLPPMTPKIGRTLTIPEQGKATVRWVHTALTNEQASFTRAKYWLEQDWEKYFERIAESAQTIPQIETGDADQDATIAWSYQQLVQSFLKPTASLPFASFVGTRNSWHGFSARGDGSDYDRNWNGQTPLLAYLSALGIASVDPYLAQSVIRNYLAVQRPDGWIDWKPGLGGQKQGFLCLPILARLAWGIFQYTEDTSFLREVFPGLMKFFERWFAADTDTDSDGLPEWQSENQTGYPFMPTFATWQTWGQNADIRCVETPDLASYLLSEGHSLRAIAYYLRDSSTQTRLDERIIRLEAALESLWNGSQSRYVYRDRDTHITTGSLNVIHDARAGEDLLPALELNPANRLVIRIAGGVNLVPRMTLILDGGDSNGQPINENTDSSAFVWSHRHGAYTSKNNFARIDRVKLDGLTRVYRVDVQTLDTTRADINSLLPLWSIGIPAEHAQSLKVTLTHADLFWRPNGVTMCSAQDPNFDPSNADGAGGVWPFWLTLIGEGLIETGSMTEAYDLLKRLLKVQTAILKDQKNFSEFYHSDEAKGLGERGHTGGIVPLYLLMRVLGVRIISSGKAWVGGPFVWDQPVVIRQRGVIVRRSRQGSHVEFPSGYAVDLTGDDWHEVIDSSPPPPEEPSTVELT